MSRVLLKIVFFIVIVQQPAVLFAVSPAPVRERIEWCNIWITNADSDDRPRVLFIGDSIAQGYFPAVEKRIGERANCARLTSSRSVYDPIYFDELSLIIKQYDFSVIHVNNGLHGWGYSEDEYRNGLDKVLHLLSTHGNNARIIWAHSTPVLGHSSMKDNAERVQARNRIATELVAKYSIPLNDLYYLMEGREDCYSKDGVHFNDAGKSLQAEQVAGKVLDALE